MENQKMTLENLPEKFYLRFTNDSGKQTYFQGFGPHKGTFVSDIEIANIWSTKHMYDASGHVSMTNVVDLDSPVGQMIKKGVLEVVPVKVKKWRIFFSLSKNDKRYLTNSLVPECGAYWSIFKDTAVLFDKYEDIPKEFGCLKVPESGVLLAFTNYAEEVEV